MNRIGDYAIGYQGSDDPFENYIDECPIATKREIWEHAHRAGWEQARGLAVRHLVAHGILHGADILDAMEYGGKAND